MDSIEQLIAAAAERGASDLHLVCGLPPKLRVDGELTDLAGQPPLTGEDCLGYARALAGGEPPAACGELDLARTISGVRVRINLFRQQGHVSAAVRLLSDRIHD